NPLVGDDCLTPFPAQFFQSPSGVRIPDGVLPVQVNGIPLSAERLNGRSGFSPQTPFFVYFRRGVEAAQLPGPESVPSADAAVQVLRLSDGARIPVMAELDANALPGDRQALIIRPLERLRAEPHAI